MTCFPRVLPLQHLTPGGLVCRASDACACQEVKSGVKSLLKLQNQKDFLDCGTLAGSACVPGRGLPLTIAKADTAWNFWSSLCVRQAVEPPVSRASCDHVYRMWSQDHHPAPWEPYRGLSYQIARGESVQELGSRIPCMFLCLLCAATRCALCGPSGACKFVSLNACLVLLVNSLHSSMISVALCL